MQPRQLSSLVLVAAILGAATTAHADPITLNYHITVLKRHDFNLPVDQWRWVPIDPVQFDLSVTFDGGVTGQFRSSTADQTHAVTNFGEATFTPSFSGIPLRGAGVTGGTHTSATRVSNSITTEFGMLQEALAVEQLVNEDAFTFSSTSIQLRADLTTPLAPHAFGDLEAFLRAMRSPHVQFYFADLAATKNFDDRGNFAPTYSASSVSFFGSAVPLDSAPVPEPGTMLLVGAGIACVARRAVHRRSRVAK